MGLMALTKAKVHNMLPKMSHDDKAKRKIEEADIAIVGAGIAACALLFELKVVQQLKRKVILISDSHFFPACSLSSTATVCLDGISKGISPLGDLLVAAYDKFVKVQESYSFESVQKTFHTIELGPKLSDNEYANILRRYAQAGPILKLDSWVIEAPLFLQELKLKAQARHFDRHLITQVKEENEGVRLTSLGDCDFVAKQVVWASGAHPAHCFVSPAKIVTGQFINYSNHQGPKESFSYEYKNGPESFKVIYRQKSKELLIGTWDIKQERRALHFDKQRALETLAHNHWKEEWGPPPSAGHMRAGQRSQSKERRPWWGKLEGQKRQWGIYHLYRNGWSYAFLAASQLGLMLEEV